MAYALLRIAFGINFAGHGLFRITGGLSALAHATTEHLAKPRSHTLTLLFLIEHNTLALDRLGGTGVSTRQG